MNFFLEQNENRVPNAKKVMMDRPINRIEIKLAIKSFKINKTPGYDGLSIEYYKKFIDELTKILHKLYQECFDSGKLTESMYYGIITQLYKESGNRRDLRNWRPLTMLNVDYKIVAKVLQTRMNKVMSLLVDAEQTCSVPGRNIQDGILALRCILEDVRLHDGEGLVLSVDHMSAFDML